MASDDMNHMEHLESVALSDCAVLQSKEATYQGSWKRAGGVSAWFMARRNLDRLITMMAPKQFPDHITTQQNVMDTLSAVDNIVHYAGNVRGLPGSIEATRQILAMLGDRFTANDIFAKIRANPGGEDGTVLAIVRDARRYFMLVEAEMIAEGVVEPESKTYEQEANVYVTPETDIYQLIADEKSIPREEVKRLIHELFYNTPPAPPPPLTTPIDVTICVAVGNDGEPAHEYVFQKCTSVSLDSEPGKLRVSITPQRSLGGGYAVEQAARHKEGPPWLDKIGGRLQIGDLCTWMRPEDGATFVVELHAVEGGLPVVKGEPAVPAEGRRLSSWSQLRYAVENKRRRFFADGGSQHSSMIPWEIPGSYHETIKARIGDEIDLWWRQMTPGMWRLYPVVLTRSIPRELRDIFELAPGISSTWVLRLSLLPPGLRDEFPRIQVEMNDKEYDLSPSDFKFMYRRVGDKWVVRDEYREEWGVEA